MTTHKCPHPKCDIQVSNNEFACPEHWLRLPVGLRHMIDKRYREFRKFGSMFNLRELKRVQAEGIEFFKPKEALQTGQDLQDSEDSRNPVNPVSPSHPRLDLRPSGPVCRCGGAKKLEAIFCDPCTAKLSQRLRDGLARATTWDAFREFLRQSKVMLGFPLSRNEQRRRFYA